MNTYRDVIKERFGGVLRAGKHDPDGEACALEAAAVAKGLRWTDQPASVGLPDLRPLNDAHWPSDEERTAALVPVVEALWDWSEWSSARQQRWAEGVALRTVREILPIALRAAGIDEALVTDCASASTLSEAERAARAARAASVAWAERATSAAWAAWAAWAARAAWAVRDEVLELACRIWREEAERG